MGEKDSSSDSLCIVPQKTQCCEWGNCPDGWNVDAAILACSRQAAETDLNCVLPNGKVAPVEWDTEGQVYLCKEASIAKLPTNVVGQEFEAKLCNEDGSLLCRVTTLSESCRLMHRCCENRDSLLPPDSEGKLVGPDTPIDVKTVFLSLSWLDRLLPLLIILAMVIGVVCGNFIPNIDEKFDVAKLAGTSLPIAIGLWLMMWPVLTKVRYEKIWEMLHNPSLWAHMGSSLLLNWVIGPALMTGLAWATLPDLPGYRSGVIMVGLARCIAMVLIWNQLANGNAEFCAILVAINSVLQIILYAPLALLYLVAVSGGEVDIGFWEVARSVLIFLGAPLVAGIVTRYSIIAAFGRKWLDNTFLPYFGPVALLALIYTVWVMFTLQGEQVVDNIGSVCRVAVPMILYFSIMWVGTLFLCLHFKVDYDKAVTQAFTASSNNFELAIAVAVGTFGITSEEALAATVGPLIEVPVLLALVYVALWMRGRLGWK